METTQEPIWRKRGDNARGEEREERGEGCGWQGAMPTLAVGMLLRSAFHMPTAIAGMAPNE
ncbi:MAG: hypothetical protein WCB27_04355, partial [Thermoguttaceae bacterium]